MRMRGLGLALLVGAMLPGASRAQSTPVPGALKPYVKDGTFDSGDFGWMAGRFATEGTAARAAWESVEAYKDACIAAATGQAKAELAAMGAESANRSEEHTSELQSLMRSSYDVFCLRK